MRDEAQDLPTQLHRVLDPLAATPPADLKTAEQLAAHARRRVATETAGLALILILAIITWRRRNHHNP
jgi:hypothetical protein